MSGRFFHSRPFPISKGRHPYSYCNAKHDFEVFGEWLCSVSQWQDKNKTESHTRPQYMLTSPKLTKNFDTIWPNFIAVQYNIL